MSTENNNNNNNNKNTNIDQIPEFTEDVDLILDLFDNPQEFENDGSDNIDEDIDDDEIKNSLSNHDTTTTTTTTGTTTTATIAEIAAGKLETTTKPTAATTNSNNKWSPISSATTTSQKALNEELDKESVSLFNIENSNNNNNNNSNNSKFISPNKRKLDEISIESLPSPSIAPKVQTPSKELTNDKDSDNSGLNITPKDETSFINKFKTPSPCSSPFVALSTTNNNNKKQSPKTTVSTPLQHQKTTIDDYGNSNNIKKQHSFNSQFSESLEDEIFNYNLTNLNNNNNNNNNNNDNNNFNDDNIFDDGGSRPNDIDLIYDSETRNDNIKRSASYGFNPKIETNSIQKSSFSNIVQPNNNNSNNNNINSSSKNGNLAQTPSKKKRIDYDLISGTRVKTPKKSLTSSKQQPKGFLSTKKNLSSSLLSTSTTDQDDISLSNDHNSNINPNIIDTTDNNNSDDNNNNNNNNESNNNNSNINNNNNNNNNNSSNNSNNNDFCPICQSTFVNPYSSPCNHICCFECWNQWLSLKLECPVCRERCRVKQCKPIILDNITTNKNKT